MTKVQIDAKKELDKLMSKRCIKGFRKSQMQSQEVSKLLDLIRTYTKKDNSILAQFLIYLS